MPRKMFRSISLLISTCATVVVLTQPALAGPPLICWPFEIGNARSLPWGGSGWRATKPDYDLSRLVLDTTALLAADVPVIVRMETLRRATVYAMKDQRVAAELHSLLSERVRAMKGKGLQEALALFDLGYLAESYKQGMPVSTVLSFAKNLNGYDTVVQAIALRHGDPEMEFAAALMTMESQHPAHLDHLRKAAAGAADGSLLARNLVSHFEHRGRTIAELRANVESAKY